MSKTGLWRCACGGSHFVSFNDLGQYLGAYLEIEDAEIARDGILERVKQAVGILRGREHTWTAIELNKEIAQAMIDRLTEYVKDCNAESRN